MSEEEAAAPQPYCQAAPHCNRIIPNLSGSKMDTPEFKSKSVYEQVFNEFVDHVKIPPGQQPTEDDYLTFLSHMRENRKYKGTSLTSILSRLDSVTAFRYGFNLKGFHRIQKFVSDCRQEDLGCGGHTRKKNFTLDEIMTFMTSPKLNSKYWQVRRAFVAFSYFGGPAIRASQLKYYKISDTQTRPEGLQVTHYGDKVHT